MNTQFVCVLFISLIFNSIAAFAAKPIQSAQVKKTIVDKSTTTSLWKGQHTFTFQWVSLDNPGKVTIDEQFGLLKLKADQASDNGDKIHIDGDIIKVSDSGFSLLGRMEMLTAGLNDGKLCKRKGVFDFVRVKKGSKKKLQKIYRLKQKANPCDPMGLVEDIIEFKL